MRIVLSRAIFSNHLTHNLHLQTLTGLSSRHHRFSPLIRHNSSFTTMGTRSAETEFVREDLEDLLKRRFFLSRCIRHLRRCSWSLRPRGTFRLLL